jgi:hypothetical protein
MVMNCVVIVREESPGHFAAWPAGIPELKVIAENRVSALTCLRAKLLSWVRSGTLTSIQLPGTDLLSTVAAENEEQLEQEFLESLRNYRQNLDERMGVWDIDSNDAEGASQLEEARRARREELKGTIWDYEIPCPPTSSTPNT